MKLITGFIRSFYLHKIFFILGSALVLMFLLAFVLEEILPVAEVLLGLFLVLIVVDLLLLYGKSDGVFAHRDLPERLSNGDINPIAIFVESRYVFPTLLEIIDELPFQFQKRDLLFKIKLASGQSKHIDYELKPSKRGEYTFGAINVFVVSPIRLLKKRYQFSKNTTVAVYPSFLQMKAFEFMAISNRLTDLGIKRIRRIGQSMEFEQIRNYVIGDDVRAVNWKATARRNEVMVNTFQEEKSQAIYCLIDKGRVMKMPFEELSLLDYAINATLVLSNIALYKQDKAGLITFSDKMGQMVLADKKTGQMQRILDTLYKQKTRYLETDYQVLYSHTRTFVKQRSLFLLFTNFETLSSMRRQLPYFRQLAKQHLLIIIFFENTELKQVLNQPAQNTEEIYQKIVAEKYFYEKQQIVKELALYGIQAMLTPPQELTVNTVNKYLELKARGMI